MRCVFTTLFLLIFPTIILSHGFAPRTLVRIPMGYKQIEHLQIGEMVIAFDIDVGYVYKPIIHIKKRKVDNYVQLRIADELICTTADQEFFSPNEKQWVTASQFEHKQINDEIELYDLTVADCHNFCITKQDLIAHNYVHIVPILFATNTACPVVIPVTTIGTAAVGGYILFKQWQQWKKNKKFQGTSTAIISFPQPPNNDDENKDKDKKDGPHGRYENASYHTPKGNSTKSKCPKNGQKALDNSLYVGEKTRIAIEGDGFVVLNRTSPGVYHGHIRAWNKLTPGMKNVLRLAGKIRGNGKIVK